MNEVLYYIFSYVLLINFVSYLLMGLDKRNARKRGFRIPEATLFASAIFGGSIGAWLGMYSFRHKTQHWYFTYGLPLILALQVIGISTLLYYFEPTLF